MADTSIRRVRSLVTVTRADFKCKCLYTAYKEHYLRLQERDSVPRCWFQPVCQSAVKLQQSLLEGCSRTKNTHPQTEKLTEDNKGFYSLVFAYLFWHFLHKALKFDIKYLLHDRSQYLSTEFEMQSRSMLYLYLIIEYNWPRSSCYTHTEELCFVLLWSNTIYNQMIGFKFFWVIK